MSFDINTNIASLQAQNFLRINSNFQGQTINEVTSGCASLRAETTRPGWPWPMDTDPTKRC